MDTLKPNMYVRTKSKGIVKIDEVIENGVITYEDDFGREWEEQTGRKLIRYISNDGWNCGLDENDILKTSHNIIDLIEEHDILLLFDKEYGENYKAEVVLDGSNFKVVVNYEQCVLLNLEYELITEEHIKLLSILTKEQFSQMEYRLGDK